MTKCLPNFIIFIKRLRQLRELNDAYEKSIPKPTKDYGSWWVDLKFQAMERILGNYGPYMTHLEQLTHSGSQPEKREEIKGYLNKWQDAGYVTHMAIFIDIFITLAKIEPIYST